MTVADWGSKSPCTEGVHEDFITKNNEIGIKVKSLRVKQLGQKLEDLAEMGANDPEYQQMIRHLEQGIQEDQLEEGSELRKMKGDSPNLGLQSLSRGKLIVKQHSDPKRSKKSYPKGATGGTHLGPKKILLEQNQ